LSRIVRLAPLAILAFAFSLAIVGCSSTSSQASSLATTASNASAAAQSASFDLRLLVAGKATSGVSDTALQDALRALQQADSTLTQTQAAGDLQKLASTSLALVRQAENATRAAQSPIDQSHSQAILKKLLAKLHRISTSLSKVEDQLKAKS
jgi:hypothetical protein